jgi:hypothetical protein
MIRTSVPAARTSRAIVMPQVTAAGMARNRPRARALDGPVTERAQQDQRDAHEGEARAERNEPGRVALIEQGRQQPADREGDRERGEP